MEPEDEKHHADQEFNQHDEPDPKLWGFKGDDESLSQPRGRLRNIAARLFFWRKEL